MKLFLIATLALCPALLLAEDAPPAAPPMPAAAKVEPQVTADLTSAYYKARAELLQAQMSLQEAQAKLDKAASELTATCGKRGVVQDAKLGLACGSPAPEPPKDK